MSLPLKISTNNLLVNICVTRPHPTSPGSSLYSTNASKTHIVFSLLVHCGPKLVATSKAFFFFSESKSNKRPSKGSFIDSTIDFPDSGFHCSLGWFAVAHYTSSKPLAFKTLQIWIFYITFLIILTIFFSSAALALMSVVLIWDLLLHLRFFFSPYSSAFSSLALPWPSGLKIPWT